MQQQPLFEPQHQPLENFPLQPSVSTVRAVAAGVIIASSWPHPHQTRRKLKRKTKSQQRWSSSKRRYHGVEPRVRWGRTIHRRYRHCCSTGTLRCRVWHCGWPDPCFRWSIPPLSVSLRVLSGRHRHNNWRHSDPPPPCKYCDVVVVVVGTFSCTSLLCAVVCCSVWLCGTECSDHTHSKVSSPCWKSSHTLSTNCRRKNQ